MGLPTKKGLIAQPLNKFVLIYFFRIDLPA